MIDGVLGSNYGSFLEGRFKNHNSWRTFCNFFFPIWNFDDMKMKLVFAA